MRAVSKARFFLIAIAHNADINIAFFNLVISDISVVLRETTLTISEFIKLNPKSGSGFP